MSCDEFHSLQKLSQDAESKSSMQVIYSKKTARILHVLPMIFVLVAPVFSMSSNFGFLFWFTSLWCILKGKLLLPYFDICTCCACLAICMACAK
jgi:hypothetical protein